MNNGLEILLKTELLHVFMQYEYTDATTTFSQCLTTLFLKDDKMFSSAAEDDTDAQSMAASTESITGGDSLKFPSAESIFVRCLVLMANFDDKERIKSILNFLLQFCPNLSGKEDNIDFVKFEFLTVL